MKRNATYAHFLISSKLSRDKMSEALDLHANESCINLMGGYGEEIEYLQNYYSNIPVNYTVVDLSRESLYRSQKANWERIQADVRKLPFDNNQCDKILLKSGLHEILKNEQKGVLEQTYNMLKSNGRLVLHEHVLATNAEKSFYENITHVKNAISGFPTLIKNRHFPTQRELLGNLRDIGFNAQIFYKGQHLYSTQNWLADDFQGVTEKLECWNEYIRRTIPPTLKDEIEFKDLGKTIEMKFSWPVILAEK